MYRIKKTFIVSASHKLNLDYESKCQRKHGHNWKITVYCQADELDKNGMVIDFTLIKNQVQDKLDHYYLNDIFGDVNTTAENIAHWICMQFDSCYQVDVEEVEGSVATYIDDSIKI